ncbi:RNA-binding (LSM) protein, putative [Bodo saltans]|uniref:RNA-binding (LSM) protein, putative n=1 Tax=Bodo saltans TaxID=75058 RepID=A0A0S4ILV3_BODSA|nr:RNA-binding (LSM) protein, putative [Bodo saltans]|eukprot:CUE71801.1 RNA-binding (LSM) protein, putative [Bodo saltans]
MSHRVVVELVTGETFTGLLVHTDSETGNVTLEDVMRRAQNKAPSVQGRVLLPGNAVRLIRLPDVVKGAPFLQGVAETIQRQQKRRRRTALLAKKVEDGKVKKDAATVKAKKLLRKQQ